MITAITRNRLAGIVHLAHNAWSYVGLFLINTVRSIQVRSAS